jgi:hypothetical protein
VASPAFATAVGLAQRAHAQWLREAPAGAGGPLSRVAETIRGFLREFFQ